MRLEWQGGDCVNALYAYRGCQHTTEGASSCTDSSSKSLLSGIDTFTASQWFSEDIGGIFATGCMTTRTKISFREKSERPCAHEDAVGSCTNGVPRKSTRGFGGVFA